MKKARRKFSGQFKFETVMELLRGEKAPTQICRERDITDKLLYRWKQEFMERAPGVFEEGSGSQGESSEQRIAELERMVGRLALENEVLKKARNMVGSAWRTNGK